MSEIDVALKAIDLYAAMHPRPPHVNQAQAAEMLRLSQPTIRKLIRSGALKLNKAGMISIAEIDRLLA